MYLSIVVPCMNEEDGIDALVTRLSLITAKWKQRAEIILVDDGSSDGTWREIETAGCVSSCRPIVVTKSPSQQV
jgi:glycosyltransferase involved in cell wall biosynthesis